VKASSYFALGVLSCLTVLSAAFGASFPPSSSVELEQAAAALAAGQTGQATEAFGKLSQDHSKPEFVRGLALFGLAESALAANAPASALKVWQQVADDRGLPQLQRDLAKRSLIEADRKQRGLPTREVNDNRVRLPTFPEALVQIYVSPTGDDQADGSKAKPFPTLSKARDAVRARKQTNAGVLPKGGIRVLIGSGTFYVEHPFKLEAQDSGTAEAPVVYQAEPGQTPVFVGGRLVKGWTRVTDEGVRAKLDPAIRDQVVEADLRANGISDWGDPTALKHRPELFAHGIAQTLARWPNEDFVKTGEVLGQEPLKEGARVVGCKDGIFRFVETRPATWVDEADVRLYGYWYWDWYEEFQKVTAIDPDQHTFTLSKPYSGYGYRAGQRYYALNLLRELDRPGEWYLDRRSGKIYWLPPEPAERLPEDTVLSVCEEPFIILENASHVTLLNLTLQEGRGDGIHVRGGSNCLVAGCTLQRFGGDALVVQGGQRHGIFGCAMRTLGCGGMRVEGGDRRLLVPGEHFVENCTVSDISRLKRTYAPAVHLDGCGNRVAHNLFQRIPSSAMRIEGNDHLIELNHVRNVVQESDDQGGIDMFGNPLYRGVVIRWNRWSDIRGGTHCGAAAIRLDDMISGTAVFGNIFERCGAVLFGAVQIHGGKNNLVDANVFIDCFAGLSFSRWGSARWQNAVEPFLKQAATEPYPTRYPGVAQLQSGNDVNYLCRNLLVNCPQACLRDGGVECSVLNRVAESAISLDALSSDTAGDRRLRELLFPSIPVQEIGPYPHPWRASDPDGS
jgi:parallel beta-helix repeat protein